MERILSTIKEPKDIKNLSYGELDSLSSEIRNFLISSVSKTGGHLASSLGCVELTLALHYVFDSPDDTIVWDVGHQAYAHKLITGRMDRFDTLRKIDGLSGFLKKSESRHDIFEAGHASTSISAAAGIAHANKLMGLSNYSIAVIGDGSMTGGMAFEALNLIGHEKQKMLIVLNDNDMSISDNVGALGGKLSKLRVNKNYGKFKSLIRTRFSTGTSKRLVRIKESMKQLVMVSTLFEDLGVKYFGPIDGHDINEMVYFINRVKDIDGPVLLHVVTKKGKGYERAESDPHTYHGVGKFEVENGVQKKEKNDFSNFMGRKLSEMADRDDRVFAITAAMPSGTGLHIFADKHNDRMIDVGIAEQNAVTFASAMSLKGIKPYVAIYSTFLQRAYDQIFHDVALQGNDVVFLIDRSGIVGNDGETHQGIYDLSYLLPFPGITVMAPKDGHEFERMLDYSLIHKGPLAIKYPRNKVIEINEDKTDLFIPELISEGKGKKLLVGYSRLVKTMLEVKKELPDIDVMNLRVLKPIDMDSLSEVFRRYEEVHIFEEAVPAASIGALIKSETGLKNISLHTLPDEFIHHGDTEAVLSRYSLDKEGIMERISGKA